MRNISDLYLKQLLCYGVFLFSAIHLGYGQYTVKNVPNPKSQGQDYFVSNPDGILGFYAEDSINALAVDIERQTTAEVAVVVITDFQGEDDFGFAFSLFNEWGVGKARNDNGLLLLVAREKRAYRFISGYGMEAVLPDALLKRIGETCLVPYFKQGQYDEGLLKAMETIREILLSPEKADEISAGLKKPSFWERNKMVLLDALLLMLLILVLSKWMDHMLKKTIKDKRSVQKTRLINSSVLPGCGCMAGIMVIAVFVLGFSGMDPGIIFRMSSIPWFLIVFGSILVLFKYSRGIELVSKSFRDEKNRLEALRKYHRSMLIPLLVSPLALFMVWKFRKHQKRMSQRFIAPDDSGDWERLDRDKLKKKTDLLDKGQLREERELSRSYEIWKHKVSGKIKVTGWEGIKAKDFSDCPSCSYHTFKQPFTKTIKGATYKASGKGERIRECVHCGHRVSLGEVVIPRKRRSSSSSSSGGGGYSGGSSSGSFGGGSSGGGGAGGRW